MTKQRKPRKPEQIVSALAEGEAMLTTGETTSEVYQKLGVAESTWMRWMKQFGGVKSDGAKRLREMEIKNQRLKELLAKLDRRMLKMIDEETSAPGTTTRSRLQVVDVLGVAEGSGKHATAIATMGLPTKRIHAWSLGSSSSSVNSLATIIARSHVCFGRTVSVRTLNAFIGSGNAKDLKYS